MQNGAVKMKKKINLKKLIRWGEDEDYYTERNKEKYKNPDMKTLAKRREKNPFKYI